MSEQATDPTILDWFFRGLTAVWAVALVIGGLVLKSNGEKFDDVDKKFAETKADLSAVGVRADTADKAAQANLLAIKSIELSIKNTELDMARLQIHITENFCNKADIQGSLQRVHEKIEDGNKKTDDLNETVGKKIDDLRRDLQSDIRAAIEIHRT